MSKAHEFSRQFVIDPFYSADKPTPSAKGLSLFTPPGRGACWLYNQGHLEAYLLERMRQESFSICFDVGHPGLFQRFVPTLHARRKFSCGVGPAGSFAKRKVLRAQGVPLAGPRPSGPEPASPTRLAIYHSGIAQVRVNGLIAANLDACDKPTRRMVDIRPLLKAGKNEITARVYSTDQPPTLAVISDFLQTDASWQVSCDDSNYLAPACLAFVGREFPHQQRLPEKFIRAKKWDGKLADFGVELLGRPVVNVARGAGRITLQAGESIAEATDPRESELEQRRPVLDVKAGRNVADENLALRYLSVKTPSSAKIDSVGILASAYPTCYRGAFACSDELLTRIWMHSAYTLRLCMREFFIDGIKRDRLSWVGDLYLGVLANCFSFGERDICRRSLTALYGQDQRHCPSNGIAEYSLYWVLALREYLMHFGDSEYLAQARRPLAELLAAYAAREDADGFLPSSAFNWVFIDWAEMDRAGIAAPLQMLYAMALEAAGDIAQMDVAVGPAGSAPQGRVLRAEGYGTGLAENCRKRALQLRRKISRAFWDGRRGGFADNLISGRRGKRIGRHANLFAILSDTGSAGQRRLVADNILLNDAVPAVGTPYMAAFECLALSRAGRLPQMLDYIRRLWGAMLANGATSFWEGYSATSSDGTQAFGSQHFRPAESRRLGQSGTGQANLEKNPDPRRPSIQDVPPEHLSFYGRPYGKSLCHAWSAGPLFLLSRELTGLRPTRPGWQTFARRPNAAGLDWLCVTVPTPRGSIELAIKDGKTSFRVARSE